MELLGVGLPELAFIILIALILLGRKDMETAGRTLANVYRKFLMSPMWKAMRLSREEFEQASTKLVREAGFDEMRSIQKEAGDATRDVLRQIQPPNLSKVFDERQVFGPSTPATTPVPISDPKPVSPLNQPETSPAPPSAPEA
jgi:Sec-independent protein translocase protein TatA